MIFRGYQRQPAETKHAIATTVVNTSGAKAAAPNGAAALTNAIGMAMVPAMVP